MKIADSPIILLSKHRIEQCRFWLGTSAPVDAELTDDPPLHRSDPADMHNHDRERKLIPLIAQDEQHWPEWMRKMNGKTRDCLREFYGALQDISEASGTPVTLLLDPHDQRRYFDAFHHRTYQLQPNQAESSDDSDAAILRDEANRRYRMFARCLHRYVAGRGVGSRRSSPKQSAIGPVKEYLCRLFITPELTLDELEGVLAAVALVQRISSGKVRDVDESTETLARYLTAGQKRLTTWLFLKGCIVFVRPSLALAQLDWELYRWVNASRELLAYMDGEDFSPAARTDVFATLNRLFHGEEGLSTFFNRSVCETSFW